MKLACHVGVGPLLVLGPPPWNLEVPARGAAQVRAIPRRRLGIVAPAMTPRSQLRDMLEALLVAAVFLGFSNTFVARTFFIPSSSMEPALLVGDRLLVNRFVFERREAGAGAAGWAARWLPRRQIRRGDVVVFRSVTEPGLDLVKRCVALAGDTVEVRAKGLWVNGKLVPDGDYAVHRDPRTNAHPPRDFLAPFTVPPGHLFCMGDNRDVSYDSRFWGAVPLANVKGRPWVVYWSFGGDPPQARWTGWGDQLRGLGRTTVGFFTETRWRRTLHLVR